jgi:hypothetical protein
LIMLIKKEHWISFFSFFFLFLFLSFFFKAYLIFFWSCRIDYISFNSFFFFFVESIIYCCTACPIQFNWNNIRTCRRHPSLLLETNLHD